MENTTISLVSRLMGGAANHAEELLVRVVNAVSNRGYDEAAHICLGVLDREIAVLNSRMKSRDYLSNTEQMMLAHLTELRSEMDRKLRGVDQDDAPGTIDLGIDGGTGR